MFFRHNILAILFEAKYSHQFEKPKIMSKRKVREGVFWTPNFLILDPDINMPQVVMEDIHVVDMFFGCYICRKPRFKCLELPKITRNAFTSKFSIHKPKMGQWMYTAHGRHVMSQMTGRCCVTSYQDMMCPNVVNDFIVIMVLT